MEGGRPALPGGTIALRFTMSVREKNLSRMGQALLKEAVLEVLFHAYRKGTKSLRPKEISKRAGIYPGTIHGKKQNHIVAGILGILEEQGKVRATYPRVKTAFGGYRKGVTRAWSISKPEYAVRSDD